jgi:hypothetical protein
MDSTDTNQASEDELYNIIRTLAYDAMESGVDNSKHGYIYNAIDELLPTAKAAIQSAIRTEKLKLLDKFENDCKYNYTTFGNSEKMLQVSGLLKRIEAERTKLEAEL